jgi:hypothetical protein
MTSLVLLMLKWPADSWDSPLLVSSKVNAMLLDGSTFLPSCHSLVHICVLDISLAATLCIGSLLIHFPLTFSHNSDMQGVS